MRVKSRIAVSIVLYGGITQQEGVRVTVSVRRSLGNIHTGTRCAGISKQ